MEKNKNSRAVIVWIIISLIITVFILLNSVSNQEKSHNSSEIITDIIVSDDVGYPANAEFVVRKAAHMIEFGFLGIAVCVLAILCRKRFDIELNGYVLFYVLLIAVIDEYIQTFSGRTSTISDVMLDFLGAFAGIALTLTVYCLFIKKKNKKEKSE